jgi:hypothetical protein
MREIDEGSNSIAAHRLSGIVFGSRDKSLDCHEAADDP